MHPFPNPFQTKFFLPLAMISLAIRYRQSRALCEILKVYAQEEKLRRRRRSKSKGSGCLLHQKMFKFLVLEISSPVFSVNINEGKCSKQLFILPISRVIGKEQCLREKNSDAIKEAIISKTVTRSRRLQAKGETCTLQTGKRCYNAINIKRLCACVCAQLTWICLNHNIV